MGTERVFVLDLLSIRLRSENLLRLNNIFRLLFHDRSIVKIGHGLILDLKQLRHSYESVDAFAKCTGIVDTNLFQRVIDPTLPNDISLKFLTNHYLHFDLDKSCQMSNWARRPLSHSQLEYAACDALVLLRLYDVMLCEATERTPCVDMNEVLRCHDHSLLTAAAGLCTGSNKAKKRKRALAEATSSATSSSSPSSSLASSSSLLSSVSSSSLLAANDAATYPEISTTTSTTPATSTSTVSEAVTEALAFRRYSCQAERLWVTNNTKTLLNNTLTLCDKHSASTNNLIIENDEDKKKKEVEEKEKEQKEEEEEEVHIPLSWGTGTHLHFSPTSPSLAPSSSDDADVDDVPASMSFSSAADVVVLDVISDIVENEGGDEEKDVSDIQEEKEDREEEEEEEEEETTSIEMTEEDFISESSDMIGDDNDDDDEEEEMDEEDQELELFWSQLLDSKLAYSLSKSTKSRRIRTSITSTSISTPGSCGGKRKKMKLFQNSGSWSPAHKYCT